MEKRDYNKAVRLYELSALQGYDKAQNAYGWCFFIGKVVEKNLPEATRWFRRAAKQGNARAQYNLAKCYENGAGLMQDIDKAFTWYLKAAQQGDDRAQLQVARSFQVGNGVRVDGAEAVKWYQKSAIQGNAEAANDLGYCYQYGVGVKRDSEMAFSFYMQSAENNCAMGAYNVAACYHHGRCVKKDVGKALKWYEMAAELGDCTAQYFLGYFYEKGIAVGVDLQKAAAYYSESYKNGERYYQCYASGRIGGSSDGKMSGYFTLKPRAATFTARGDYFQNADGPDRKTVDAFIRFMYTKGLNDRQINERIDFVDLTREGYVYIRTTAGCSIELSGGLSEFNDLMARGWNIFVDTNPDSPVTSRVSGLIKAWISRADGGAGTVKSSYVKVGAEIGRNEDGTIKYYSDASYYAENYMPEFKSGGASV